MAAKSHWQDVYVGGERDKAIVKSYFEPMCQGMTPYKAQILCDIETDREKKFRAFMTDTDGRHYQFERTRRRKDGTFTVSRKPLAAQPRRSTQAAA